MRVLLIEDDRKVANIVSRGLRSERFAVDTAYDGRSGLDLAASYNYDVIVLDLMLPALSGTEVLRHLRKNSSEVPVLVLTATDDTATKVQNFEAGADDYLTKPFAFAELAVRVKALLRRGSTARNSVLRVGDLELDRLSQQVRRAGTRIELTAKEYALLEFLAQHADRPVTRSHIIEHVWDIHFDSVSNVVEVHINSLRNKIDKGAPLPLIHTIRGVGYMLSDQHE